MATLHIDQVLRKFSQFLIYSFLECAIIIWLYILGFLAFTCSEFAKFFNLSLPCLLCTRIDHILVHRNSDFYYNDLLCEAHKKDISSLAYCRVHSKLSDLKSMCDRCLLSFATERFYDLDTCKSKNKDIVGFVEENQKICLNGSDFVAAEKSSFDIRCSCCGEPMTINSKKFATDLSMNCTPISNALPTPSPRAPAVAFKNQEVALPHIQYTELKLMPDMESEFQEDVNSVETNIQKVNQDIKDAMMPLLPDSEEDACRTPSFFRGNKFFKVPLNEPGSASTSPRFANRQARKVQLEKELIANDKNGATEGENLQGLEKQVQLDRKSLVDLYMELDEERSASAVAANNAMAMITKLQAEKAEMQMEALQYQRMMDEQAEYDQEAFKLMEDQVKALATDLEAYREKYGDLEKVNIGKCEVDGAEDYHESKSEADTDEDYEEFKSQSVSPKLESGSPGAAHNNDRDEPSYQQIRENKNCE